MLAAILTVGFAEAQESNVPPVDSPILFNTPEADAIVGAMQIFPKDNPWNQIIADWPLHPDSKAIVDSVGAAKPLRYNPDMAYVLVPPDQEKINVRLTGYPAESDPGPYPVPANTPIEGWPACYQRDPKHQNATLDDVQRDALKLGGDRHVILVDPGRSLIYEFWSTYRKETGWEAACAAIFNLRSNKLRPDGWTSADAAGLPIFPAVVRHDELKRGAIHHALRFTVVKSRRAYVAPATHFASKLTDPSLPRMGERFRLRRDFDTSKFSPEVRTILIALQQYGMFVADNGIDWAVSVAADERIPVLHEELRRVKGSDFEVVTAPK